MLFSDVIPEHTINRFLLRYQLQWELSMCHLYVASTLVHLYCLAIRFYNDFKLFCPNNKIYGISVQSLFFSFSGKFTSSVLSLWKACHATFKRLWKFYRFLTILPLSGHFDAKDIRDTVPFPSANGLSFASCFIKWVYIVGKEPWDFLAR